MSIFQMYDGYRKLRIEEHRFYLDQARRLLLASFSDIDGLARKATDELFSQRYFDPECDDVDAVAEAEYDYQIAFGQLLADMYERTRLSIIAGLAQEMEKKLRDWMAGELRRLGRESRSAQWIWAAKWDDLMELFAGLKWDPRDLPFYEPLQAMMLIVNVSKHGAGTSFDRLKKNFPKFLHDVGFGTPLYHHDHLALADADIEAFSSAIVSFWESVPTDLGSEGGYYFAPDKFVKAYQADLDALKKLSSQRQ